MKKILIVGAGRFGYTAASRLSELGAEVVVMERDERRANALRSMVSDVFILDAVDRETLLPEIENTGFDAGVVAIGDDFSTALLVCLYMKQANIPYIVARASTPKQGTIFRRIGVDMVVTPEDEVGHNLAERLILRESEQIDLSPDTSIVRAIAPKNFIGKKLSEIQISGKGFHFLFIARRYIEQGFVKIAFPGEVDFEIIEGDFFVFAGDTRRIASFLESVND